MGKRKEYEVVSYISIGGAPPVRFDSLSAEKRAECTRRMAERMGQTLSRYYSEHPDEAQQFLEEPCIERA